MIAGLTMQDTGSVGMAQMHGVATQRSRKRVQSSQAASDRMLMERIARGDRLAMRLLFARHQRGVYRFIVRMTKDASAAEDLTADVFLDVWRAAEKFGGRSSVTTWLLGIARLKALTLLRRRPHEQLDENATAEIVDRACDPAAAAEQQNRSAIIRKCIACLPAKHREVIDLVYYHEQSPAEVAEILGIPESTVKTRMFYARRRLSVLLRAAGIARAD